MQIVSKSEAFFADMTPSTTVGAGPSADGMTATLTTVTNRHVHTTLLANKKVQEMMRWTCITIRVIDEVDRESRSSRAGSSSSSSRSELLLFQAVTTMIDTPGSKSSHVSAEFGLGALTGAVGYSETKT